MVNEVEVIGDCAMPQERQRVVLDWFHGLNAMPTDMEVASWAKRVWGGEWVCAKVTQDGTYGRNWVHCTSVDPEYWIELGVDHEWYYTLFKFL